MRIVNIGVYLVIIAAAALWYVDKKKIWTNQAGAGMESYRMLLWIAMIANTMSFALTFTTQTENRLIQRQGYDGEEIPVNLQLEKDAYTEAYTLSVSPRQYSTREAKQLMQEAFHELEASMKGENDSYQKIMSDLDLELDHQKYPFDLDVQPENYSLMDESGRVHNREEELINAGFEKDEIEQGIPTAVKIVLSYGDVSEEKKYPMTIQMRRQEPVEQSFTNAKKKLLALEKSKAGEKELLLPAEVDGVLVLPMDQKGIQPEQVLILGGILMAALVLWQKEQIRQQKKVRQQQLLRSYPWFVNEMVLMLGAGMQVKHIFSQILMEYKRMPEADDREPLIRELMIADQAFHLGMAEEQIYYQLGRRLGIPAYIKLMTLLEQNVVKGSRGLRDIFEQEEQAALEERKNLARKLGEEAGTKLLGPMVLLLVIVMLLIMVPAFMSF